MSQESYQSQQAIEAQLVVANSPSRRGRTMMAWAAAGLLAAGAGLGAVQLLPKDEAPCESQTHIDGSFSALSRSLTLPNGSRVNFQIFDKSSDVDFKDPHLKVVVDGHARMIEAVNTPGPEAVFTIGDATLFVEATDTTITTSCAAAIATTRQ